MYTIKKFRFEISVIETEMIVLKTNEHQIEDYINLSKSMGVDSITCINHK